MSVANVVDVWKRFRGGSTGDLPDAELLTRFVATLDESAFEALVRRHASLVWGVCRRLLLHHDDAEDAFQTTFLVLARKAATLDRHALLANWLFGVARRAALVLRRSRKRRAAHETVCGEVPDVRHVSPELWNDVRAILDEEIARLPAKYRQPLLLCCLEGHTHTEAAGLLAWPVGTVAGRVTRARELLRQRLQRRGVSLTAAALAVVLTPETYAVPPGLVSIAVTTILPGLRGVMALSPQLAATSRAVQQRLTLTQAAPTVLLLGLFTVALGVLFHHAAVTPPLAVESPVAAASTPAAAKRTSTSIPRSIRLPDDPQAVVLRLEHLVQHPIPTTHALMIHADGQVVGTTTRSNTGQPLTQTYQETLSREDLQDLMQDVVWHQELFEFDPVRIQLALQAEYEFDGNYRNNTQYSTTTIQVRTADREHEIHWDHLGLASLYFRDVRPIRQICAVERRLMSLLCTMQAGGREHVDRLAADVNNRVGKHLGTEPPLTHRDLVKVERTATGSTQYSFMRGWMYDVDGYLGVLYEVLPQGTGRVIGVTPRQPLDRAPTIDRRAEFIPRCFEDDLDPVKQ